MLMRTWFVNTQFGWGNDCLEQTRNGRGGICFFRLKHYFALQAFAELAVAHLGTSS
jgi:hypothetical protein